jgi:hypothetical protein
LYKPNRTLVNRLLTGGSSHKIRQSPASRNRHNGQKKIAVPEKVPAATLSLAVLLQEFFRKAQRSNANGFPLPASAERTPGYFILNIEVDLKIFRVF